MRKTKHLITTQGNRTARRCIIHFPFDPAMETALGRDKDPVEYCARPFHFLICLRTGIGLVDFARHSERGKKTKQTEEEVGRQHQGMEGLEFAKSQRAAENREKWRKRVAKSSVVPQRPSRLRDR